MKKNGEKCQALLQQGLVEMGLGVGSEQVEGLCRYYGELVRWGGKMNLVALGEPQEILLARHFLDSLSLLPLLPAGPCALLDVGTGAGFPGLVLKVVRPDLQLSLVEPRGKRVTFLRHIIRTLQLQEVEVKNKRLEGPGQHGLHQFDLITSRAFTDLAHFLPLVEPYLADDGQVITMKGPKAEEELALWQQSNPSSTLVLSSQQTVTLPFLNKEHQLLTFRRPA